MKKPRLGLFSRFFLLFGVTTILLGFCIAAGMITFSEDKARSMITERHDSLVSMLSTIEDRTFAKKDLEKYAEQVKGQVLIRVNGERNTTWQDFPSVEALLEEAEQYDQLYFAKHESRYYLLYQLPNGWVAVTSNPFNFIIFPWWAVYWPWLLGLGIITASYLILRRWLRPVVNAVQSVKQISTGDFTEQIEQHPKNELADLTRGINQMATELKNMFDAKNELLLAISHELRTPLARMRISLALIEGETQAKQDIASDLSQMDKLIEQLLEGERLEQGHKALNLTSVYLPMLIDDVLSETDLMRNITLVGKVPEVAVSVDVGRVKFLLRNLLLNALKHNTADVTIRLTATTMSDVIEVSVEDSGQGIPSSAIEHLFEPFYRVENVKHRDTKGTGLGLYLCKKIAEAHGGELTVISESGKGCRFTFSVPFSQSN